ncbi:hypothetical protein BC936DRAFT_142543 [Jimgerdemannia flammicorona]|uniref:Uncharacterized protein n=1 Tax=Jimgerdemannia flammicorona TaxID=994334 RepID=A0A433A0P4_9FUNG|nr:hypothetical protein BC936DRAFT_142543 [Jimgerdemannia flammicorona]
MSAVDNITVNFSRLALAKAIKTPDAGEDDAEPWQKSVIFHQSHIPQSPPPKQRRGAPRGQGRQQQQLKNGLRGSHGSRSADNLPLGQSRDYRRGSNSSRWDSNSDSNNEDLNSQRSDFANQKRNSDATRAMPKSRLQHQYNPTEGAKVGTNEDDDSEELKPPQRSSASRSSLIPSLPSSAPDTSYLLQAPHGPSVRRVSASAVEGLSQQSPRIRNLQPPSSSDEEEEEDEDDEDEDEDTPIGARPSHQRASSSSFDQTDMMATVMAAGSGRGTPISRQATPQQRPALEPGKEEPERVSAIENWRRTMVEDAEGLRQNPYHDMVYYNEQQNALAQENYDFAAAGLRQRPASVDQLAGFGPMVPPPQGRFEQRTRRNTLGDSESPLMMPVMQLQQQPMATRSANPNRRSANRLSMSGMDILLEREAQRAELTKNQRRGVSTPKQPHIEGLLAKLPTPGMGTVNFQQQQQQQSKPPKSNRSANPNQGNYHPHSSSSTQKKRPPPVAGRPASSMGFTDHPGQRSPSGLSQSPRHHHGSSSRRSVSPHGGPHPTPSHSTPILSGMMMDPSFGGPMFLAPPGGPGSMMGLGVTMGPMGNMGMGNMGMGNMGNMGSMGMVPMMPMGMAPMGMAPMGMTPSGRPASMMGVMGPGGQRRASSVGWNGLPGTP